MTGEETELDRTVIDEIGDPLHASSSVMPLIMVLNQMKSVWH